MSGERGRRGVPALAAKRNVRKRGGLRSVESALVSVLPEDPSLRSPPLSAHRSYNQPREEDDAHLEAAIFSNRSDPLVKESLGRLMEMAGKIAEYDESWMSGWRTRSPVLHVPAGMSD